MEPVEHLVFGLKSWVGEPPRTSRFTRHDEIELNYMERGRITRRFQSRCIVQERGSIAVFWGIIPHQVLLVEAGTVLHWLTVPLAWFLQAGLPQPLTGKILRGEMIVVRPHPTSQACLESFRQWHRDLKSQSEELRRLVLLEVEARLRRTSIFCRTPAGHGKPVAHLVSSGSSKVEVMLKHIASHYTERIRVAHLAELTRLHPDYVVSLFKKACGVNLVDYICQHRISHAQRLLVTTDEKIIDVAFASGFRSLSRFYEAFGRICGRSPRQYRRSVLS